MIAAIVRGGRSSSFKGALDYVLRLDPERVGEVETVNLFSSPDQVHVEMQTTVDAAKAIQARARAEKGERSAASGSRAEKVCFHYALSWHPDDAPTSEHMLRNAHRTLERLGLTEHQAVIAEHTERSHKHLHVIVSALNPETGRVNGLYRSEYVLNRWAHEYEKGQDMIRSFKRAAVFDREHEWKKVKVLSPGERKAEWSKRQRELSATREKDAAAIKAHQEQRRETHESRVNEIRRHAEIDKINARNRHSREIAEFWRKQAPKMSVQPRPSPSFLRGMATEGGEMGKALKGLIRTTYHSTAIVAERRTMEQNKGMAHSTFSRAKASQTPLQKPAPEPPARSTIYAQFRDRSENSKGNALRHHGITDRFQGEQTIKRWQRGEIDEIDRRMREAIEQLRNERDLEANRDRQDWADHKEKHDRLREGVRKELGMPEPKAREQEKKDKEAAMDVRSYVNDYIAGRGRDSADHEQFAANHGKEIEEEFQRRAKEMAEAHEPDIATDRYGNEIIDMSGPVAPEHSQDEPPPFEPDDYVPADRAPPPPDMDFEIGD